MRGTENPANMAEHEKCIQNLSEIGNLEAQEEDIKM
jgi:hypothetical protein